MRRTKEAEELESTLKMKEQGGERDREVKEQLTEDERERHRVRKAAS